MWRGDTTLQRVERAALALRRKRKTKPASVKQEPAEVTMREVTQGEYRRHPLPKGRGGCQ